MWQAFEWTKKKIRPYRFALDVDLVFTDALNMDEHTVFSQLIKNMIDSLISW